MHGRCMVKVEKKIENYYQENQGTSIAKKEIEVGFDSWHPWYYNLHWSNKILS